MARAYSTRCTHVQTPQPTVGFFPQLPMFLVNSHPLATLGPRVGHTGSLVHSQDRLKSQAWPDPDSRLRAFWAGNQGSEGMGSGWAHPFGPADTSLPGEGHGQRRARAWSLLKSMAGAQVLRTEMHSGYLRQ